MTQAAQPENVSPGNEFAAQCIETLIALTETIPKPHLSSDAQVADRLATAVGTLRSESYVHAPRLVFQVLEKEPQSAIAYAVWGLSLVRSGEISQALMAFDTALILDSACLPALGGKILLLALRGAQAGAAEEATLLRRSLQNTDPGFRTVFQRLLNVIAVPEAPDLRYLNIGGGPNFRHDHWRNLEAVASEANRQPFEFGPDCVFPLEDASFSLVYSSHCIEHLDDPTVERVLAEARRVVRPDGALILKIPDFDRIADDWRRGETDIICAPLWGLEALQPLWQRRGIADGVDARAAMIFCGFWNDAYAGAHGHFAGAGSQATDAYHGPPPLDDALLAAVFSETSPHAIAALLRQRVVETEPSYHFNHQNAWSRMELDSLLSRHAFRTLSFDARSIRRRYSWIPEIDAMDTISTYCFAVPQ